MNIGDEMLNGWFIGWDYAHYNDYCGYDETLPIEFKRGGKKWTTEEIQEEVYFVCRQLRKVDK